MKLRGKVFPLIVLVCIFILPWEAVGQKNSESKEIDILLHQPVRMSDGIQLSANIYKPAEMNEPLPAIFTFTPYISDEVQVWCSGKF
jgi:predicted acyl esterase